MFLATGNAQEAVIDAVVAALKGDTALAALVTGVYGVVPKAARTSHPYVKVSDPLLNQDAHGGMGIGGGRVTFSVDLWAKASGTKGAAHRAREIQARLLVVLERRDLTLVGFRCAGGSLHCTESLVFEEPDPDMPEEALHHGHQAWEVLVDEL